MIDRSRRWLGSHKLSNRDRRLRSNQLLGGEMASRQWVCDSCHEADEQIPWECSGCGNETCEHCFWLFAHCKKCSEGKTDEELRVAANEAGFEFEPEKSST